MGTIYILILVTNWSGGMGAVAPEFGSEKACRDAIVEFKQAWDTTRGVVAICVPRDK